MNTSKQCWVAPLHSIGICVYEKDHVFNFYLSQLPSSSLSLSLSLSLLTSLFFFFPLQQSAPLNPRK
jgi:hypothetical protein